MSRRSRKLSTRNYEPQVSTRTTENIIDLVKYRKFKRKKIELIPRSINQESYLLALESDTPIVIASGPAGTGKTMLATLWAIKEFQAGKYEKIIITRPNVAVDDRDIGFLPGDIMKKMTPWMLPILDVFKEYYSVQEVENLIKEEIIQMVPIAYIRGRTFKNSVIILDEAQGTTKNSMLSILTRIGEGSKMVITGDIKQSDRGEENGLRDLMEKISQTPKLQHITLVKFNNKDIERHPAVKEVLNIYKEE